MTVHVVDAGLRHRRHSLSGAGAHAARRHAGRPLCDASWSAAPGCRRAWWRMRSWACCNAGRNQPEGASYFSAVREEDFRLDWSLPAERLRRMIRVSPGQCFADLEWRRLYFLDAEVASAHDGAVATGHAAAARSPVGRLIQAGDGALRVHRVKIDGRLRAIRWCRLAGAGHSGPGTVLEARVKRNSISCLSGCVGGTCHDARIS